MLRLIQKDLGPGLIALEHGIVVSHSSVGMVTGCVLCPVRTEAEEIIEHVTQDSRTR
jgi:hypothetical protein